MIGVLMTTGFLIMKLLHVLFAALFLGNIIISILWKRHADKTNDKFLMAHTLRGLIKADRVFTMPSVIGLIIFGFGAQGMGPYSLTAGWILWSIVLLIISAAAFMAKVVPVQKKLLAEAESSSFSLDNYNKLTKEWNLWGLIAIVTPLIALVMMVLKMPA
jgi:uncharacterized membrane protein